jgi:hypothetical protein
MSAIASDVSVSRSRPATGRAAVAGPAGSPDAARLGYAIAALTVLAGWVVTRYVTLVDPVEGLGYWLGIVGASLMTLLLLYPIRSVRDVLGASVRRSIGFGCTWSSAFSVHC